MWEYHGYVLQMILDYNGGNEYPKHRPKAVKDASKKKRQRRLKVRKCAQNGRLWPCGGRAPGQ